MSAFIVDEKTINRILSYLYDQSTSNRIDTIKDFLKENGLDLTKTENLNLFGTQLRILNKKAVDYRYDENNQIEQHKFVYFPVTPIQALKSLNCLIYQCSEGDIIETATYKFLEKLSYEIAYQIATSTREYYKAEWG